MRILHIRNLANYAWRLAEGQRALGHYVEVWSVEDNGMNLYKFPYDRKMPIGPHWNFWMWQQRNILKSFDIVHVHGGIWRGGFVYAVIKMMGPKIFGHFHGSETRLSKGLYWRGVYEKEFVSTPDLLDYLPNAIWIPHPVEILPLPPKSNNDHPLFAFFGSTDKGEERIRAFAKEAGVDLRVYKWISNSEVRLRMQEADVVIDQFTGYGAYGTVAVEAMALGKPVVGTLERTRYPRECPIESPSPLMLRYLADHPAYREELGALGREYVLKYHDQKKVAREVLEHYASVS